MAEALHTLFRRCGITIAADVLPAAALSCGAGNPQRQCAAFLHMLLCYKS